MIFTDKIYPRPVAEMILNGSKCQTRRLVKAGQETDSFPEKDSEWFRKNNIPTYAISVPENDFYRVLTKTGKVKWQVGQDYAVQLGRGKVGLYYPHPCNGILTPLRIKITSIPKERLLDITEEDAKKEGFKNRQAFLYAFFKLQLKGRKKTVSLHEFFNGKMPNFNPEVWVINFEVKK